MKKMIIRGLAGIAGIFTMLLILAWSLACSIAESEHVKKPVGSIEILRNRDPIPDRSSAGYPVITVMEEKSVVLTAQLTPDGIPAGIHWQSSRNIVDLSELSGLEIVLFARYGGETTINVRAMNVYNEVPVFEQLKVTVVPTSYYKWDYQLDGWKDMAPLSAGIVDRIYNKMLLMPGSSEVNGNAELSGLVLEGPATLMIGSAMSTQTNSMYDEDPLFDQNGQLNLAESPSKDPGAYTGRIRISVDYTILAEPGYRQGLRLQVNNNTLERDRASVFSNWLVAEYTAASPHSGTLTGIFDAGAAFIDPQIDGERGARIPGLPPIILDDSGTPTVDEEDPDEVKAAKRLNMVKSRAFVCLALPDGKVLIRSIRIETAQ